MMEQKHPIRLLYTWTLVVISGETNVQSWVAYTDKIVVDCLEKAHEKNTQRVSTVLLSCVKQQQHYLGCEPYSDVTVQHQHQPETLPCGWIKHDIARSKWELRVHRYLNIYLTFHHFVFPMPHGICELQQASEFMYIWSKEEANIATDTHTMICGNRSSFSLIRSPHLQFYHISRNDLGSSSAFFLIHYQVCDRKSRIPEVHVTSHHEIEVDSLIFPLQFNPRYLVPLTIEKAMYSFHVIGDRFRILDVVVYDAVEDDHQFEIDAFDGPGPAAIHRYNSGSEEWNGVLFFPFLTFQGYVQITCHIRDCLRFRVEYTLSSALPQADAVFLQEGRSSFKLNYPSEWCHSNDNQALVYCLLLIRPTNAHDNLYLSLEDLIIPGPDYVASHPGEHHCLQGGLSIADRGRMDLFIDTDSLFLHSDGITRRLVADSTFPEMTSCYKLLYATPAGAIYNEFPQKTFTSTTGALLFLIYAFGGYTDLSKMRIRLTVTTTSCYGVNVGCPVLYSSGILEIIRWTRNPTLLII